MAPALLVLIVTHHQHTALHWEPLPPQSYISFIIWKCAAFLSITFLPLQSYLQSSLFLSWYWSAGALDSFSQVLSLPKSCFSLDYLLCCKDHLNKKGATYMTCKLRTIRPHDAFLNKWNSLFIRWRIFFSFMFSFHNSFLMFFGQFIMNNFG